MDRGDDRRHPGIALQMRGFVKIAPALALDRAKVKEAGPVAPAIDHAGQVVVRPHPERFT